ncbi:hypothetical protein BBJ29_005529 [Phytophthora kernoviae]|uniref:Uncharacterized protein n=1 Tax=Phytophthora kernoviae TaxID=325452 RepID=A0A3F2S1L2_9STRA|nr:hypothetical protein BBP00_00000938 [Phytophthora kernoviae]RLN71658.1 hypothetical protein BBJ29_005529 [Phytophthora kernoviae]
MELFPSPTVDANETRYCFFLPTTDTASTDEALHNVAEQQCTAFLSFAAQQTSGFLWHKHRFHLSVSKRKSTTTKVGPYYLSGRTAVGDAIQDEWVVAKLIFQLTKRFPGVIARLADTDGEFLLIESAEALPDWVTPEDSDHRVFIVNGKLHIAPPASDESSRCKEGGFYDEDALEQVLDVKIHTEASTAVQRLIQQKLDELVGPAVEAFYYREPKHAGFVCGKMAALMSKKGEHMKTVEQMVTFSRAMFAQLKQQDFFPPKPFLIDEDSRFRVLQTGNSEENKHPDALAADIGVKLTCGLELLYAGDGEDQLRRPWKQTIEELLRKDGAEFSALPVEPDDDDSWLYMHPDTLESQLQQAAMAGAAAGPGGADELQNMAAMFGKFVDGVSGVDGVEGAEPVQFDMSSFMDLLNGQTGGGNAAGLDSPWGEHFMDEDDPSPSDSDDESEEEGDEDLALEKAMAEMEAELAGTKVAKSFSRFEVVEDDESEASHEHKVCDGKAVPDVPDASSSPEKPLDLDYNLLSNLLKSVASQEGYAGPVSTILSEMNFPKASV